MRGKIAFNNESMMFFGKRYNLYVFEQTLLSWLAVKLCDCYAVIRVILVFLLAIYKYYYSCVCLIGVLAHHEVGLNYFRATTIRG